MPVSDFLADLRRALAAGNVSPATEAHIRHVFRAQSIRTQPDQCGAVLDREVAQLEREAAALRAMREQYFG